jgi:site-specific DNA-methyltransferase (adenine-specific)
MVVAIEDAGWQIRDQLAWVYCTGFPKSLNVSKTIDASILYGKSNSAGMRMLNDNHAISSKRLTGVDSGLRQSGIEQGYKTEKTIRREHAPITAPATPEAEQWEGWGTALKPAHEPIVLARKPLVGTVANNVQEWGTGGLNIDGCRVPFASAADRGKMASAKWHVNPSAIRDDSPGFVTSNKAGDVLDGADHLNELGRWPGNFLHDGSQMVMDLFPGSGDQSASRFFYCPKASKQERELGLDALDDKILNRTNPGGMEHDPKWAPRIRKNIHPTVKPVALMRYLVRLVTPPGGLVLDPFTGSGSTGVAAIREGFKFCGVEANPEYLDIIRARLQAAR